MKKPKNYYCHKSQSVQMALPIASNLQIVEKIGQGAFGQVFKVFDTNSSEIKVIKRHKRESSKAVISKQNQIMREMSGSEGFAKIKDFYSQTATTKRVSCNQHSLRSAEINTKENSQPQKANNEQSIDEEIIMMECLGQNLGKVVSKQNISIYSMKRIAEQLILRLKQLHQKNYVHRDLKPENILLGNQLNPHKIYLVDFGLVSTYRKDPKKVRKIYDGVVGTAKYCPLASHYGNEQFPRDDLQSLGYVLVNLVQGELPWRFKQEVDDQQKFEKMRLSKQSTSLEDLCQGVNCLKNYFKFVKNLKPSDEIEYGKLVNMFKTQSRQQYCFQFCRENCHYKIRRFQQNSQSDDLKNDKGCFQNQKGIHFPRQFLNSKFINK